MIVEMHSQMSTKGWNEMVPFVGCQKVYDKGG